MVNPLNIALDVSPLSNITTLPAWAEGAVQTALNAVWGVMTHLGGRTAPDNPGPGDLYPQWGPIRLDD